MPPSSQSRSASSTARRTTTTRCATCKRFVGRLKEAKADVELTEYPKAEHGFDNPLAPNPARPATNDQSVRECTIREGEGGTLVNDATKASFTYKDECVRLGPLVGHDPGGDAGRNRRGDRVPEVGAEALKAKAAAP